MAFFNNFKTMTGVSSGRKKALFRSVRNTSQNRKKGSRNRKRSGIFAT